jgi:hypothetical protein
MLVSAYSQFAAKLLAVNDDGRFGGARRHWFQSSSVYILR